MDSTSHITSQSSCITWDASILVPALPGSELQPTRDLKLMSVRAFSSKFSSAHIPNHFHGPT